MVSERIIKTGCYQIVIVGEGKGECSPADLSIKNPRTIEVVSHHLMVRFDKFL